MQCSPNQVGHFSASPLAAWKQEIARFDRPHVEANKILFMNIPAFLLALQDEGRTREE
jgi:hypothetical protein